MSFVFKDMKYAMRSKTRKTSDVSGWMALGNVTSHFPTMLELIASASFLSSLSIIHAVCMENPEIPGWIQMERFIPVEIFRKKSNTFSPFLPKRPKFSVPFVWITSARLHVLRKRKLYGYFVNGTTQSRSCFWCQKNTSTIWQKFSTKIAVQIVSAPDHRSFKILIFSRALSSVHLFQRNQRFQGIEFVDRHVSGKL